MHLVVFVGDGHWPAIQAVSHWSAGAAPLGKVSLCVPTGQGGADGRARGLERWVRETLPDAAVELVEGMDRPRAVRVWMAGLLAGPGDGTGTGDGTQECRGEAMESHSPAPEWVVDVSGLAPLGWAGLTEVIGQRAVRVVGRHPELGWVEYLGEESGEVGLRAWEELRREGTDGLSVAALVRSQFGRGEMRYRFVEGAEPDAVSVVALTQTGIRCGWRWGEAFEAAGVTGAAAAGGRSVDFFARYLQVLLRSLGVANVVRGTGEEAGVSRGMVWVNQGGRLAALDLGAPESAEDQPGQERSLAVELVCAAERVRALAGLGVSYVLIRPGHRLGETERELAQARGVRVFEERDCHELPERLAQWFGIPMSTESTEASRLLRVHLAESGRARVFGEEAWVVREQTAGGGDPVLADVDTWLQRIQVVRGQNWMTWTHRNRICIRVPAEVGRADTVGEWRLVLAMVLGQPPEHVNAVLRDQAVWLDLADQAEVRRRVSAWFRPFLNAPISFAAAQGRFAAEARINTEAAPQAAGRPASAGGLPARNPSRSPVRPAPTPAPARRGGGMVSGGGRPGQGGRSSGLEDLDQALDGLGG